MSPSAEERLSALETENTHTKELLREIKTELMRLPRRISKNTQAQLADCRAIRDAKHVHKMPAGATPADDYSWIKKAVVALMAVGSVIGGAVWQYQQVSGGKPPAISMSQEGSK